MNATSPPFGLWQVIRRGASNRCPACGQGRLCGRLLSVRDRCGHCGFRLGRIRADDAPPYVVLFLTGHAIMPSMLMVHEAFHPSDAVLAAIFLPLTALVALALLRPVKGAIVGIMLRLGMPYEKQDDDGALPAGQP